MKREYFPFFWCILLLGFVVTARSQVRENPVIAVLKCPDRVHAVAFSPNDRLIAAGIGWGTKGGARIWAWPSKRIVADITSNTGDDATVEAIAFSPDGKQFAMADWGGNVTIWDTSTWRRLKTIAKNQKDTQTVSFSPDGSELLIAREGALIVVDVQNGAVQTLDDRPEGEYVEARFSSDNENIVVSDGKSTRLVNVKTKRVVKSWNVDNLFFGKLSDDGRYLVSGGGAMFGPKLLRVMDLRADKTLADIEGFRDGLYGLAFAQSKRTFAVSGGGYGSGGFVSVWDTEAGKELGYVTYGDFPIQSIAYSRDDKLLAAGSKSGSVVIYDAAKIRGPEVEKQENSVCGEVLRENGKTYLVPLTKVSHPMNTGEELNYNWKLEIINTNKVASATSAVAIQDWAIESSSRSDKVRIINAREVNRTDSSSENIVFAEIQNPGWNLGRIVKMYSDGSYVVTDNPGKCVAIGTLDKVGTSFDVVKNRLLDSGFLKLAKKPLMPGSAHFSARFIGAFFNDVMEVRSDAEDFEAMLKGAQPKKREAFNLIYSKNEPFLKELVRAGGLAEVNTKRQ